ncbi:hypothetical protein [Streptomyces purpurogeneiscleroticus]|uniref:hypothetical protein n=1 Tax=Streptomyces purpurogeneiscleroticus TaxID=68259 RepID=UPI001CBE4A8D|nr:hypothetical protein [Streptomyces purpurogeneiscleroticus]
MAERSRPVPPRRQPAGSASAAVRRVFAASQQAEEQARHAVAAAVERLDGGRTELDARRHRVS